MENLPKIELKLTKLELFLEIMGYLLLVALWGFVIYTYSSLPEQIPIHFNGVGKVDDYHTKRSIFMLPVIGTFLFVMLTYKAASPENETYKVNITEQNRESQYRNTMNSFRMIKIIVATLFLLLSYKTWEVARAQSSELGVSFLILCAVIVFLPLAYFTYKSYTLK